MYKITPWHYYNTAFNVDGLKTVPNFSGGDPREDLLKLDTIKVAEKISPDNVKNLIIKLNNLVEKDALVCFSKNLEHLYLLCGTAEFPNGFLEKCENLLGIYITYNKNLKEIPGGFFSNKPILNKLVINHAEINLTPGIFAGLKCLEDLDLQENNITELGDNVLSDLPNLQKLILAHNKIKQIAANVFSGNTVLTQIDLSNNALQNWTADALPDNSHLKYLKLSNNKLESVCFRNLKQLFQLNLDFNKIQRLDTTMFGEQMEMLDYLALNNNKISVIEEGALVLNGLRILLLDHNQIRQLDSKVFEKLPHLQHVSMDHNNFSSLQIDVFTPLKCLNNLVLSRCNLTDLTNTSHTGPESLLNLHLEDNNLTKLNEGTFTGFSTITTLDINDSKLEILEMNWCVGLESLKQLNLSGNKLSELKCDSFKTLECLKTLNVSGNCLVTIEKGAFNNLSALTNINLCDNKLEVICDYMFGNLTGLRSLALGNNEVAAITNSSLGCLPNLIYLDLSENRITEIEELAFANIKNLVTLDLGFNGITTVSYLSNTPELAKLILSYNYLKEFDCKHFHTLTNLSQLYIDNNEIKSIEPALIETSAVREFSFDDDKFEKEVVQKIRAVLEVRQIRRRVSVKIEPRMKCRKVIL